MKIDLNIPDNKPFDAVGIGLNAVDHLIVVPRFPERNTKSPLLKLIRCGGGQIANAFCFLSRLGLKVKYLGKVGSDEMGAYSLDSIKQAGVDVSDVVIEPNATNQFAYIIVDESTGERTIMWNRHAGLEFRPDDFSREAVISGRILHLDGHEVPFSIQAAKWAEEEGIPILLDAERLKDRTLELLPLADVIIADEQFCQLLCPNMEYESVLLYIQKEFNPKFCAVTLGERGSLGYFQGEFIKVPAYPVKVVDTTGAGDIYHAGFVYGILQGWEIPDIMRFSSASAALSCRGYGGRMAAPTLDEIREMMGHEFPQLR